MNHLNDGSGATPTLISSRRAASSWLAACAAAGTLALCGLSQTATLSDAWWTYQQDCNGDGCQAGTLAGDHARLNWNPDVTNCNGTLTVFEIVYSKPTGSGEWTAVQTNAPHAITGCRSSDAQFVDLVLGGGCVDTDYRIEIYRVGQTTPDAVLSGTNNPALHAHREQRLAEDFCANDYFASCRFISGRTGLQADNNSNATKEPGEPDHAGNAGGKSLWYGWTAPDSSPVTFDTTGSSFDTLLAVYTGNDISNLVLVASNDDIDGANNRRSRVTFTPSAGAVYHVAVDGFGGASGIVNLSWNQSGAALPDLIIWGPAVSPTVSTRTFTASDCEVVEGCETPGTHTLLNFTTETRNIGSGDLVLGDPSTNSLFRWASCHGHYHFEEFASYDLVDTNGNVVAAGHKVGFCLLDDHVWSSSANPQARYDCNFQGIQAGWADAYAAGLPCQYIDITGIRGGQYNLRITVNPAGLIPESETNNNATLVPVTVPGPEQFCLLGPFNDNFFNAMNLTNSPITFSELNECATKEPLEPNHAGDPGGHSIWFRWTPSSNQVATLTTKRSDFATLLAVYTGTSYLDLALVASNAAIVPGFWQQSQVSFGAIAGTTYHIAVDGYGGAVGTAVLNLNPPENDDFANATVIAGGSGTTNDVTIEASKEPFERAHAGDAGGHSVWYRWTAPASGPVDFNTRGSTFSTVLAVYTGDTLANLAFVAANVNDVGGLMTSRVDFNAAAGTNYLIAVDGVRGDAGNLVLNWNMESRLELNELPDGQLRIAMKGVDWQRYTLEGSIDLLTWLTNHPTFTMPLDGYLFTNNVAAQCGFYRAKLWP